MPQILPQPLPPSHDRLAILQHEQHPRPLGPTRIFPRMDGRPLDHDLPTPNERATAIVQLQEDIALQHDGVVETLRAVHHPDIVGCEVHDPADRAVRVDEAYGAGCCEFLVLPDVRFVVQVGGGF